MSYVKNWAGVYLPECLTPQDVTNNFTIFTQNRPGRLIKIQLKLTCNISLKSLHEILNGLKKFVTNKDWFFFQ